MTDTTESLRASLATVRTEVGKAVVGQDGAVTGLIIALLAGGHVLLEGVPGLAKTLTVKTLATVLGGTFRRVQFTPDLVPADLVGTRVWRPDSGAFDTELGIVKTGKAKPVREAAQVMRIWIAEWTDKNDDLHYPGYLFTEIQPRRWSVGKAEASGRNTTVPFRAAAAPTGASSKEQPVAAKPAEGEARQSAAMSMPGLPSPSDINLN